MIRLINTKIIFYVLVLLVSSVLLINGQSFAVTGYGAQGVKDQDDSYTLKDMLIYAIQDEYLAKTEYEMIINQFGNQNPFSNIIKAEEYHISLLIPLFEKYKINIPEDTSKKYVIIPEDINSALKIGVEAEIDNIKMYDLFLEQELPQDIKEIFEILKRGSENHLKAFNNGLNRNMGRGQGYKNNN
ncbi:MAG: DUF2202 domain-containing protein [Halanaerobiales bacterium]|nr:DUF2202 domain-containing protein [Halanaerobiales bacterium]